MSKKALSISMIMASLFLTHNATSSELGHLKGIKWKQELPARGGEFNDMVYGRLDRPKDMNGDYIVWDRLATQLKQKGVEAVAFRIDREDRYIDENGNGPADEMAQYHGQLKKITGKLKEKGIKVYLFARIWLTTKDNNYVFDRFNTYLSTLTEEERNQIDGIGLTEVHLSSIGKLKTRARWIPSKFENVYPGWLKERAFFMPGLELGFRFNGINQDDTFHEHMNNAVGEFAFSVKAMKLKQDQDSDNIYARFPNHLEWAGKSIEEREEYIGEYLGINELMAYQQKAETEYPHLANIIFWGDSGDSLTNIHPKGAQALHNVLTKNGGENYRTTFMYAGVGSKSQIEDPTVPADVERVFAKSVVVYDEQTDTHSRHHIEFGKWENVMGTYAQWHDWSTDNYMNSDSPYLLLENQPAAFDASEQSYTVDVSANIYWQVTNLPSWITSNFVQGHADGSVDLTLAENNSVEDRQATIKINDEELVITQEGLPDFDKDGIADVNDADDDNDDFIDEEDAFPFDETEWLDTDGDLIGNNADSDDDNDEVADSEDAFPLDATESADFDGDMMGDNADNDDDNDGVEDSNDQHLGLISGNLILGETETNIEDRPNAQGVPLSVLLNSSIEQCKKHSRKPISNMFCTIRAIHKLSRAGEISREEMRILIRAAKSEKRARSEERLFNFFKLAFSRWFS